VSQVIIYTNENGGVSVCTPTGELPIEEVLVKDCPAGAMIVDAAIIPKGDDDKFFNAWKINGSSVSVDMQLAQTIATNNLNAMAKTEASHRLTNTAAGISNKLSDTDWLAILTTARNSITAAKTTTDLVNAVSPVEQAIQGNA